MKCASSVTRFDVDAWLVGNESADIARGKDILIAFVLWLDFKTAVVITTPPNR